MSKSDIAFHMALQNVLLLQLISIGACVLSSQLSDVNRDVCAWVVPTVISLFSIYICVAVIQSSKNTTSDPNYKQNDCRDSRWNGVVYVILVALVLSVVYSGYNVLKKRTLESLWKSR
jgi:hypothetical protein